MLGFNLAQAGAEVERSVVGHVLGGIHARNTGLMRLSKLMSRYCPLWPWSAKTSAPKTRGYFSPDYTSSRGFEDY